MIILVARVVVDMERSKLNLFKTMIKLIFKTITPLHISNGEDLGYGIEYIVKNNVFLKLNLLKVSKKLSDSGLIDFMHDQTINNLIDIIERANIDINDSEYKIPITTGFYNYISNQDAIGQKFVKEFINSNGRFYIPGSSIKGTLLTILGLNKLGINPTNAKINDKFVIRDSKFIPQESFLVMKTSERPPSICLVCLKKNIEFVIEIVKKGQFDIVTFKKLINQYSEIQIQKALSNISRFKGITDKKNGTDFFIESLENIRNTNLSADEYLINLGFGGGSWFKIEKNGIPKFISKNPKTYKELEPAHTTYTFNTSENYIHIGWCKLKISED